MSQLKAGAALSYFYILLTNVVGLVLTPFIINSLGDSEYGLYTLIGGVVAYISVLDLGLNNTIIRYISKYRAEKNKEGEKEFLGNIMLVYLIIALVIFLIGGVIYLNLSYFFSKSLSVTELESAKVMFAILVFNLGLTIPGGSFTAICTGYEKFIFPRAINIVKYGLRTLLIYGLLSKGGGAITLVWIDTVLNVIFICVTLLYVFVKLKINFKISFKINKPLLSEVFGYSIWIFIYAIVIQLQWNTGQVILGLNVDTISVAIFGVGVMLGGYYVAFASVVNTLLLPKATQMTVLQNDRDSYNEMMSRIGRLILFMLLPILTVFFLFGQQFIHLWIGKTYDKSWLVALIIMLVMTLPLVSGFGNSILEGKQKNKFKSILSIITLLFGVFTGYFLSQRFGLVGMIYPIAFAILFNSIIMLFYYRYIFQFSIFSFFKNVFFKSVINMIILIVLFSYILSYYPIRGWFELMIMILMFLIFYIVSNFVWVFNQKEKDMLWLKR